MDNRKVEEENVDVQNVIDLKTGVTCHGTVTCGANPKLLAAISIDLSREDGVNNFLGTGKVRIPAGLYASEVTINSCFKNRFGGIEKGKSIPNANLQCDWDLIVDEMRL
jgi:hypothetical protein